MVLFDLEDESSEVSGDEVAIPEDVFEDEDIFVGDDEHWLSEDHLYELHTSRDDALKIPPPLKDWKETHPTQVKPQVTFGKAHRVAWQQGQAEINLHDDNVKAMKLSLDAPKNLSSTEKVYHRLLGSTSPLANHFVEKLEISPETYLRFLITFFKSCRFKMSVKELWKSDDKMFLMSLNEYNGLWTAITNLPSHSHGKSFWQAVEYITNDFYHELYMLRGMDKNDERFGGYVIGLDDDKVHFNWSDKTDGDQDHDSQLRNGKGQSEQAVSYQALPAPRQHR